MLALTLGQLLCLPACAGHSCDEFAALGVVVFVVDATTGDDVCSATVAIADGAYAETLQMRPGGDGHSCEYAGATERPGTYAVTVSAPSYQTAEQDNVVAQTGTCHVQTATVTIMLAH